MKISDEVRSRLPIFPNASIVALDICGLVFWVYLVVRLLVGDFERWIIVAIDPGLAWVADFRMVWVLAGVAIAAAILRRRRFIASAAYVIFFPIVVVVWKIPFILIRLGSWTVAFAVLNFILSAFTYIVYRIVSFAMYTIGFALVLFGSGVGIVFGVATLVVAIFTSYVRAFIGAFRSPRVLVVYAKITSAFVKIYGREKDEKTGPRGTKLSEMPIRDREQYISTLQHKILSNRGAIYLARRLQEYQKSDVFVASGILTYVGLITMTLASFSVLYFGIDRVWPDTISSPAPMTAFDYIWLAFNNMLFGGGGDVVLETWASQSLSMMQRTLSILLIGTFLTMIVGVRSRKYENELKKTVSKIEEVGRGVESDIVEYYKYENIEEAIQDLVTLKAGLAEFLVRLSATLDSGERRA